MSDSKNKYSVSYEWTYGDIGGRCIRFFKDQNQADIFFEELDKQLVFPGVEIVNRKIGGGDE